MAKLSRPQAPARFRAMFPDLADWLESPWTGRPPFPTGQVFRLVGNNLAHYRPWEIGEQFLAKDKEGNAKQWDPADIGRIVNRYVFNSENPGIDAQRRA